MRNKTYFSPSFSKNLRERMRFSRACVGILGALVYFPSDFLESTSSYEHLDQTIVQIKPAGSRRRRFSSPRRRFRFSLPLRSAIKSELPATQLIKKVGLFESNHLGVGPVGKSFLLNEDPSIISFACCVHWSTGGL